MSTIDNGVDKVIDVDATDIAREYYTDYSKYVLEYRALPSVEDGLKPVQRRIIYTANQFPLKLMKTAKLSGAVMAYHPHGSASIDGAINEMAHPLNVFPLFTTKGNFGGVGFGAAASRYTECYLSEAARFNFCQFVDYADYELGEIGLDEPKSLPCLIPYALFKGSEGIGIGLSTKVMPLNLIDLIDYYIDYIKNDGASKKTVKPDVGYVLLEMEPQDVKEAVYNYKGKVTASSVINQISDTTFLVEGLFDRSIDAVINKMDKWGGYFSSGKVGFRDASTSSLKYIFEIYDSSVNVEEFKDNLRWATHSNKTFTRVVEKDGCAIYSNFEYVVKESLACLNRAIDRMIETSLIKNQKQLELYEVLRRCKELGVFKNITEMSSEELVNLIARSTDCTDELAREVIKRPISYLTRSHDKEEEDLRAQIESLTNHDRKKYLIKLYKDFRKMIMPTYESKKHSISRSDLMSNPCVSVGADGVVDVKDGVGDPFDSAVYFVSDAGAVYRRNLGVVGESTIVVETSHNDQIKGLVTDKYPYIEITTRFSYPGWVGKLIVETSTLKYDKVVLSLREEDGEYVDSVRGLKKVPKDLMSAVKTKLSKSKFVKD